LLIITDGVANDLEDLKKEIVEVAVYPISIIIVGVGIADFKDMDSLGFFTFILDNFGVKDENGKICRKFV
jgi:hypothetical protein